MKKVLIVFFKELRGYMCGLKWNFLLLYLCIRNENIKELICLE